MPRQAERQAERRVWRRVEQQVLPPAEFPEELSAHQQYLVQKDHFLRLPEPESVTQIPSCANQGTDNVYNFGTVEVTAFQTDAGEIIYSIYILDANTPTDLGLYLGDGQETVEELYGTDYTTLDGQLVYAVGNSSLVILLDNDQVLSIDHRWEFD